MEGKFGPHNPPPLGGAWELQELNALRTTCGDAVQAAVEQRQKGNGDGMAVLWHGPNPLHG